MREKVFVIFLILLDITLPKHITDRDLHTHWVIRRKREENKHKKYEEVENSSDYWIKKAQQTLNEKLHLKRNTNVAKNIILFLGDGMSIPTLAAARIYQGQLSGLTGEETYLSFEKFPYSALSKTYCVNSQVSDSACTATAYLGGVKGNIATIGVNGGVTLGNCQQSKNISNHVSSIGQWSQMKEKWTGIVTTTRVTHASPAGVYAHTAHRDWESDKNLHDAGIDPKECTDIADQLINGETGKNFHVILGGGRQKMLPEDFKDEEGKKGERLDGRNLIKMWEEQKKDLNAQYVFNRNDLLNVSSSTDYLLGLFEDSHCMFNLDKKDSQPSLEEMTEAAIKLLSKSEKGFFLFVEGGLIDHAHHQNMAQKALDETLEFSKAVKKAHEMTNDDDTLIVVTADHSHTLTFSGYPVRGNDIFGFAGVGNDNLSYSTLSYANGPGYKAESDGKRYDLGQDDMHDKNFQFSALTPLQLETHGGDDVGIFANGPWAHLFSGVLEENLIPHFLAFAACIGNGVTACDEIN